MVGGDKPPTFLFYKHEKTYIYINIWPYPFVLRRR